MASEDVTGIAFPWSNTRSLDENLRNGELSLATAIGQFSAVIRESLKIFENYASDHSKTNLERKLKLEKMDKLVNDLSEKCQGMQQALLYKEEKYDEKCREVERYKVICELSAKAAVSDDIYYTPETNSNDVCDNNNNNKHNNATDDIDDFLDLPRRPELFEIPAQQVDPSCSAVMDNKRNIMSHIKLDDSQTHMRNSLDPLQSASSLANGCSPVPEHQVRLSQARDKIPSFYVGGPCKRKKAPEGPLDPRKNTWFQERLECIGGINVKGPTTNSGVVPLNKLYRPDNLTDQNKKVKISLLGQSNEVMSSSRGGINQIKQKFTEKNLHRQVAGGYLARLSSRRKKEWPF